MQPDRPVWTGVPINPVTHLGSWETEEGIRWSWWHLLTVASQSLCEPLGGGAHWGYTLAGQHTTNRQRWGARRVQWQFRTRPPSSSRRGKQQCSTCAPPESPGSWSWRSRQKLGTALWAQPLWWVWKARPQLPSKRQVCEQASEAGQSADGNEAGIWEQLAPPTEQPASQGERGHDHLTCCAPDSQLTSSFTQHVRETCHWWRSWQRSVDKEPWVWAPAHTHLTQAQWTNCMDHTLRSSQETGSSSPHLCLWDLGLTGRASHGERPEHQVLLPPL